MIKSVPELLAISSGSSCQGAGFCYFCGASCEETYTANEYVKSSFTGRDGVAVPGSPWVCHGCVLCLREDCTVQFPDHSTRDGQRMRSYSWVITKHGHLAASKAHLSFLRDVCLHPPDPPFAICLSDSGQKQLLYRAVVCHERDPVAVTLEGELIRYRTEDLRARLVLCGQIAAAAGKPSLSGPINIRFAVAVLARYVDGEDLVDQWASAYGQPLTRLATWLTPNKETCSLEYPSTAHTPVD